MKKSIKQLLVGASTTTAVVALVAVVAGPVSGSSYSDCVITASPVSTGFDPSVTDPSQQPNIWGYVIEDPAELAAFQSSNCSTLTIKGNDADVHNAIISTAATLPTDNSVVTGHPLNNVKNLVLDIAGDSTITLADAIELHYLAKILNDGVSPASDFRTTLKVSGTLKLDDTPVAGNSQFTTFADLTTGSGGLVVEASASAVILPAGLTVADIFGDNGSGLTLPSAKDLAPSDTGTI